MEIKPASVFMLGVAAGAMFIVAAVAPTPSFAQGVKLPRQIVIATPREGGAANLMANGFAKILTKYSGTKATVRPIGAAAKWMGMIKSGDIDLGLTSQTDLGWAYWGTKSYKGRPNKTFSLVALGTSQTWGFGIDADAPVNTAADLKKWIAGKRLTHKWVSPVIDHLNTAGLANLGFEGGVEEAKIKPVPVSSYRVFVSLWNERRVDAFGAPTGISLIRRMNAARPLKYIPMFDDPAAIARMQKVEPAYYISRQKSGVPGVSKEIPMLTYDYCIIVRNSVDPAVVTHIMKTARAKQDELAKTHRTVKGFVPAEKRWARVQAQIPYHPGAIAFYKSIGVWSTEMAKHNDGLVAKAKK